jgi:hypothetical protein
MDAVPLPGSSISEYEQRNTDDPQDQPYDSLLPDLQVENRNAEGKQSDLEEGRKDGPRPGDKPKDKGESTGQKRRREKYS